MQVWFTTQEIADFAAIGMLPGMPATKMGITKTADRERWQDHRALARRRSGREGGGGFEYHLDLLPLPARLTYVAKSFRIDPADLIAPLVDDGTMSARARAARDARLVAVRLADAFRRSTGLGARSADDYFCRLFNAGSIEVPEWLQEAAGSLSPRTLARWRSAAREDTARLGFDPATARKGTGLLDTANDGAVKNFVFGLIAKQPHLSAKNVRIQCRAEFGDEIVDRHGELKPMPLVRDFQRLVKALKAEHEVALTKLTNPDKYRSHFALSGTNAFAWVTEANQLWQIDASPVDVLCLDGRHSLYMCLDLAPRRIVITTSKTPRASAVGLMTRKAILKWGAPKGIKTDNGSDFVAKETDRLFRALGVDVQRSQKYTPQEKGHVERVIKTFQHDAGPLLPGFIGHDVADRKAIESRKSFADRLGCDDADAFAVQLTAAELQRYIDEWVEYSYSHDEHAGLGGLTPAQAADASAATMRRVDERALDVLLMPLAGGGGIRTVSKRGLKIDHHYYQAPELLPGTRVLVRMDPMDAGRARAFSVDGDIYLAEAICYELAGLNPAERLKIDRAKREAKIAEVTGPARAAVRHLDGTALIDRHLEVRKRDAAAREAERSNVIRLPRREEVHTTPQIEAAAESTRPMPVAPQNERAAEIHRQLLDDISAPMLRQRAAPANPVNEAYERYRRALQLEQLQASGAALGESDARWLAGYREGPEYAALSSMRESFGEAMGF